MLDPLTPEQRTLLRRAGFIDEDDDLTEAGVEALHGLIWRRHADELVALARAAVEEESAETLAEAPPEYREKK